MTGFLRAPGALVLGLVFTGAAIASPAMEAAFDLPEWLEQCELPSATASSPIMRDDAVQLASDNEPAAAKADHDSCGGCNACGQCCCCACPPSCYVSVGTVILHRSQPNRGVIVAGCRHTNVPISRGSDFDFGWDAGPDVTIGYYLDCENTIEGRFFDDDAEATNTFRTPSAFVGAGFLGGTNALFEGRYTTQLYSSELNWRHSMNDRLAFLAGIRWIELADEMGYRINSTVATGDYQYNNHLYGGQLGLDWALTDRSSPLQIKAVGKAGLYGNSADGGIYEFQGSNFIGKVTGDSSCTSFVGEIDLTAAYWLTNHVAIRGGYQLLWLDDVALASDAAARSLTVPGLLRTVDSDQNLFYHGAIAGIDFVW